MAFVRANVLVQLAGLLSVFLSKHSLQHSNQCKLRWQLRYLFHTQTFINLTLATLVTIVSFTLELYSAPHSHLYCLRQISKQVISGHYKILNKMPHKILLQQPCQPPSQRLNLWLRILIFLQID